MFPFCYSYFFCSFLFPISSTFLCSLSGPYAFSSHVPSSSPFPHASPTSDVCSPSISPLHSPLQPFHPDMSSPSSIPPHSPTLRKSYRQSTAHFYLKDYVCQLPLFSGSSSLPPVEIKPFSYSQTALVLAWQDAMRKEFDALDANHIWDIVTLPSSKKPIGCKWVYKIKYKADGSVERCSWQPGPISSLCGWHHHYWDDTAEYSTLKQFLDAQFKIKDLGCLHYFLGIEVSTFPGRQFDYTFVSPVVCPLELNCKLHADAGDLLLFPDQYRSLKSKKQPVVSLSSAEAKYRALSKVVAELTWFSRLLSDFGLTVSLPIFIFCDNQVASYIARNLVFHERTKHIEVDCHFIRTKFHDGLIHLSHVPTSQ
ncbi:uncharacterized protein LOC142162248 [Nicotiana tabacum]|uniref:Uncharacterized protein LOC142162248 n=1 Tax=Nicotiana tabacum TaxID=4097 RepID=A0AC58RPP4_TOBAC